MTHCRVNNNWTNEDPKAVGKHFAKGGKEQQKLVHSKYSTKCLSRKKQEKIFSHKNKNLQTLTSVDLHYKKRKKKVREVLHYKIIQNITRKKQTHRYREHTSGYQWGEKSGEGQERHMGVSESVSCSVASNSL